ncbi:TPA: hypothetical protein HA265_02500 [Candidatus Woesearchaeota archaeon]|nr:hypothetical protein [Candidatus Woesearchaeota archaeon]
MKIEIDTKRDTKEEIMHLAAMLQALSRTGQSRLDRKLARIEASQSPGSSVRAERHMDIFDSPSPNAGFMGMFGDSGTSQSSLQEIGQAAGQSQAGGSALPSSTGDLFSLFSSPEPQASSAGSPSMQDILGEDSMGIPGMGKEEEEDETLKDLRLVPY